jgi:hypothetical protein
LFFSSAVKAFQRLAKCGASFAPLIPVSALISARKALQKRK